MAQTNLIIRVDENIKKEADLLFDKIGFNSATAINVFLRQAIRQQAIPFELKPYNNDYSLENSAKPKPSVAKAEQQENQSETSFLTLEELEVMKNKSSANIL